MGLNRSKRHQLLLSCAASATQSNKKPRQEDPPLPVADLSFRPFPVKDLRSRRIFGDIRHLGFQTEDGSNVGNVLKPSLCGFVKGDARNEIEDSASQNKSVFKSSFQRKVFKVHGSNRYRRLLPFLIDMAKDDTCNSSFLPCIPQAEKNGLGPQNSNGTAAELPKVMGNLNLFKDEDKSDHSDGLRILENEEGTNCGTELSSKAKVLDVLNLTTKTEGNTQLHGDRKGVENSKSSNEANECIEELAVSKIDEMDLGVSSKVHYSIGTKLTYKSIVNSNDPEVTDIAKPWKNGDMKNHLSCEAPETDQLIVSGTVEGILLDNKDQISNGNGDRSNGAEEYAEPIQTTTPEKDIFYNLEMNVVVEKEEVQDKEIVIQNDSLACESTQKEDICLKTGSNFKRKGVLNPCSRGKVFKTPGSFSYRRLLPYLMNVSNDYPHSSLGIDASNYPSPPTVRNDAEDKKPNMDSPVVESHYQKKPLMKPEASFSSTEHAKGDLALDPPPVKAISNANSSDDKSPLASTKKIIEIQKPLDSSDKSMLFVEQVIYNTIKSLEPASGGENSKTGIGTPSFLLVSSGDNESIHRDDVNKLSHSEWNSSQATIKLDSMCLDQKSTLVEESFTENPVDISKGILRRNPRGCRGLCNCLNCMSFRLHADRAFEFSRNQMLDVEELTSDLIKELSRLRNMLKETVNSHGQSTPYIDQVTVACSKALKAEESAKCRLQEMHCDLTVHCRSKLLERPRVRFANHVKEMVIADVEISASND